MTTNIGFKLRAVSTFALFAVLACGGVATNPAGLASDAGGGTPPGSPADAGTPPAQIDAGAGATTDDAGPECVVTGSGVTGAKKCSQLIPVAQSCASKPAGEVCVCLQDGFKQGTAVAQGYAAALFDCAKANACTDLACVSQKCGSQLSTCFAN